MSKEIKAFLDYLTTQTGFSAENMASEIESALEQVVIKSKKYPEDAMIKVQIDPSNGELEIFRVFYIVENDSETLNQHNEVTIQEAESIQKEAGMTPDAAAGQSLYQALDIDLGRIAATQAKQLFKKIIQEGQIKKQKSIYQDKIGSIAVGTVKRVTRDFLIIEISDQVDGILYKNDMIPRENYRIDDKIKVEIASTDPEYRSATVQLSRTSNNFLKQLFISEVPEIHEGSIEIKAIARDPGSRAKIAVKSNDRRVDPIGACIGIKGTRVQAVSNEINGERIDIILWDDSPAKIVIASLSPGEIHSISVDEESTTMEIGVLPDQLAQVIGRNGQNIRLATQLSGWTLNLNKSDNDGSEVTPTEQLAEDLGVDAEIAEVLLREGLDSVKTIASKDVATLASIEEFDDEIAEALYEQAKSRQLELTLSLDEESELALVGFESITQTQAERLKANDIHSQDDLAELAVDELTEIIPMSDEAAGKIILAARAPWFDQTNPKDEQK
ncbi:MAG: transcription termination/antitermination protein NusA [Legionellales bacterium]|jgi:N utilization substance protein A|nr:transcription termination/antitermination protein NusA [Legionellales bacterium]